MIQVLDFKGDWWDLQPGPVYRLPDGVAKYWAAVMYTEDLHGNRVIPIKNYDAIPLPVFTDWWPTFEGD